MKTETAPLGTYTFRDGVWYFTPAPSAPLAPGAPAARATPRP